VLHRFGPPLGAVAAVVLVIVLLLVLNRPPHSSGPGPALQSPPPVPTSATPTPAPSPSGTATPTPTPKPTKPTLPSTQPSATAQPVQVPVTVLNNSRRRGLAHDAAGQLQAKGWPIARVGNFTGRIAASTVYYSPGQRAVAERLAHEFSAVQRVEPRFSGLPGSGLTLVVTRYWPA
jgi:hypothetical protein